MQVKGVVFDLEGTLFSSSELSKLHMFMVLDLVSRRLGTGKEEALDLLVLKREEMSAKLGYAPPLTTVVQAFGIGKTEFFETIGKVDPLPYIKPDVKLKRMLSELRNRGLKLALLTNVSYEYAERILRALGINGNVFDCLITGSDMEKVKPDSSSFHSIVKSLNLDPRQILMVGDRIAVDLEPAREIGMRTALVTRNNVSLHTESSTIDVALRRVHDLTVVLKPDNTLCSNVK